MMKMNMSALVMMTRKMEESAFIGLLLKKVKVSLPWRYMICHWRILLERMVIIPWFGKTDQNIVRLTKDICRSKRQNDYNDYQGIYWNNEGEIKHTDPNNPCVCADGRWHCIVHKLYEFIHCTDFVWNKFQNCSKLNIFFSWDEYMILSEDGSLKKFL